MWNLKFFAKFRGLVPLVLRLVLGFSFAFHHGLDKLTQGDLADKVGPWDWGAEWITNASGMASTPLLYLAAYTEFFAGVGLFVGFLTRWSAVGICCVMGYAILKVHGLEIYGPPKGYEFALAYFAAAACVLFLGPGRFSLDRMVFGKEAVSE
ncbi:MAG: DoxX family protein [Planctomycetota bacterium]